MLKIIQRICWNTKDWKMPTGSTHEKGFPDKNGYGHEEWNFNLEDNFNGFIFPYTYSVPQYKNLEKYNGKFTIGFFAQHPASKRWMLIGFHSDVELIKDNEYQDIIDYFDQNGNFNRRAKELNLALNYSKTEKVALKEVRDAFVNRWVKVKCRIEKVQYLDQPVYIDKPSNHRFAKFTYVDNFPETSSLYTAEITKPSVLAEEGYLRESDSNLKIIIPRHNKLSNAFCKWLRSKNIEPIQEKNFIDVLFSINKISFIAELKITYGTSTRKAIRESIGQLFEYNLYPNRKLKDEWLIVLDVIPTANDKKYIDNINKTYNTRITLVWKNKNGFDKYSNISNCL